MQKRINSLTRRSRYRRGNIAHVPPFSSQTVTDKSVDRRPFEASTPLLRILILIGAHRGGADFLRYALQFAQPRQTEVHLAILGAAGSSTLYDRGPAWRMNSNLCELAQWIGHDITLHRIPSNAEPGNELRRLAMSRQIEVMFMVTQGGPGMLSVFLKSAHERIIRFSPCPVVAVAEEALGETVDGGAPWPLRRILMPVRFPLPNVENLRLAAVLASNLAATVDLLGVQEHMTPVAGTTDWRQSRPVRKLDLDQQITRLATQAIPARARGRNRTRLVVPFCQATLQAACNLRPDLIAVGVPTKRWEVLARVDRSTERILRRATRPVVCLPEAETETTSSLKELWAELWQQDFKRVQGVRLCPLE